VARSRTVAYSSHIGASNAGAGELDLLSGETHATKTNLVKRFPEEWARD
jgi:hypothetical protein